MRTVRFFPYNEVDIEFSRSGGYSGRVAQRYRLLGGYHPGKRQFIRFAFLYRGNIGRNVYLAEYVVSLLFTGEGKNERRKQNRADDFLENVFFVIHYCLRYFISIS